MKSALKKQANGFTFTLIFLSIARKITEIRKKYLISLAVISARIQFNAVEMYFSLCSKENQDSYEEIKKMILAVPWHIFDEKRSNVLASSLKYIRDVDMAEEMMTFTKSNILSQAATSMLAQANAMPNSVLNLLQG